MEAYHHVHLELARERGKPAGDSGLGYDLIVPLDPEGHIDVEAWRAAPMRTRVRRFRDGEKDAVGWLGRDPNGRWRFDFNAADFGDDVGYHLQEEAFRPGEYVSIQMFAGGMHVFRVVSVQAIALAQ